MRMFFAAVAALCLLTGEAFAQSGIDLNPVMTSVVMPLAVTVLSGVASAMITWAAAVFARKTGVFIEARDRESLHSAIVSGINLAVAKTGQVAVIPKVQVNNPFTRIALEYVLRSVPDAVKRFNLSQARIEQMILAKLPQVMEQKTSSVSPPVSL